MKLLKSLTVLALSFLTAQQSAQATVAVYTGTEQQLRYDAYEGQGGNSFNGIKRVSGRIYFLYEVETGRSVEIRVQGTEYKVRTERNLQRLNFQRAVGNSTVSQTFLSHGADTGTVGDTVVSQMSWEGVATFSGFGPEVEVATGLPRGFPRNVTSRQQFTTRVSGFDGGQYLLRRNDVASLLVALTKTSNTAADNFDAALQRLKTTLNAQGKSEVPTLGRFD